MQTPGYAKRIRHARELSGKSAEEMASLLEVSNASYRDLESFDEEVLTCLSLRQVDRLCRALGISSLELLSEDRLQTEPGDRISLREVVRQIGDYMRERQMTIEEFEEKAGWEIEPALGDSEMALEWSVDCLKDICAQIGVNALKVLPIG
jgi:transcriptional regulator with XRE-family HTH domain